MGINRALAPVGRAASAPRVRPPHPRGCSKTERSRRPLGPPRAHLAPLSDDPAMGPTVPCTRGGRLPRDASGPGVGVDGVPSGARARWNPRHQHRGCASHGRRRVPGLAEPGGDARRGGPNRIHPASVHPLEETDQPPERFPRLGVPSPQRLRHPRLRVRSPLPEGPPPPVPPARPCARREPVHPGGARPVVQPGLGRYPRGPAGVADRPERGVSVGARGADRPDVLGGRRHGPRPIRGDRHHALGGGPLGAPCHWRRMGCRHLPCARGQRGKARAYELVPGSSGSSTGFAGGC